MSRKDDLNKEKNQLIRLKGNLGSFSVNVSKAAGTASNLPKDIDNVFLIDGGSSTMSLKSKEIYEELSDIPRTISSTVIPSIDSRITAIDREIAEIEEEERRQREEEERRREADEKRASSFSFWW